MIKSITLTYQSLGSDRERTVVAGPVEVDLEYDFLESRYDIDGISFDRTEVGYPGSNVYLRNDDVRADIELDRRPREEITSYASVYHSSGAAAANQEVSDDRTISHRLEHPGLAGRYTLTGTIGEESGLLYDTYEEKFFVVFNPPTGSRTLPRPRRFSANATCQSGNSSGPQNSIRGTPAYWRRWRNFWPSRTPPPT